MEEVERSGREESICNNNDDNCNERVQSTSVSYTYYISIKASRYETPCFVLIIPVVCLKVSSSHPGQLSLEGLRLQFCH